MQHYYTDNSNLNDEIRYINFKIKGIDFKFKTNSGVFSKSAIDFGTKLLIETLSDLELKGNICDVGCGYGPIGIIMKKLFVQTDVTMIDINPRAVGLTDENSKINDVDIKVLVNNGLENIKTNFNEIITNPPIRCGKQTIFKMYEDAYSLLEDNGRLFVVIQKKQGANSTVKKLEELFGNCQVLSKSKGYFVYCATKIK